MSFLEETAAADKSVRTAFIPVLLRHLKLVASPQVRNVGSVSGTNYVCVWTRPQVCMRAYIRPNQLDPPPSWSSGNLMMVHNWAFTSDIWTILMAVGAELQLLDSSGGFNNVPLYGFEKVRSLLRNDRQPCCSPRTH
jgi:CO/xanthine dehydrogenase FAD-binding subunit